MALRSLLRESFRLGNRSAPLVDEFLDADRVIEARPEVVPNLVSILIPVRGAHAQLALCLLRLGRWAMDERWTDHCEVVIACAEAEAEVVRNIIANTLETIEARVVTSETPQGYPANINLARKHARGEMLVTLNSDAFVGPGWLDALLVEYRAHAGCGAVGPEFQIQAPINMDNQFHANLAVDALHESFRERHEKRPARTTRRLVGFCMLIETNLFDMLGGLWTGYGIGNWDDDDFSTKIALAGRTMIHTSACSVVHPASASFKELPNWRETYNKSLAENERKYRDRWGWILPDLNSYLDACDIGPARHNVYTVEP